MDGALPPLGTFIAVPLSALLSNKRVDHYETIKLWPQERIFR